MKKNVNRIQTIPIGSKVMIKQCSQYYRDHDPANPIDIVGIVDRYDEYSSVPYFVTWSNEHTNGYGEEDLEIVEVEKSVINNYQIY